MVSLAVVALSVGLAATHVVAGRIRFISTAPRSRGLSFAGGVSVAYVFVHLLPEVTTRQAELAADSAGMGAVPTFAFERWLFLVALAGFTVFYGLERLATRSDQSADSDDVSGAETEMSRNVFWVHVGSFVAYGALVGYLLVHREGRIVGLVLYAVAMALHFLVNDFALREHHEAAYDHVGRWLMAGAVLAGTAVGLLTHLRPSWTSFLLAFLAGGIVLNVIKEELPEKRTSRFWSFALGAGVYAVVLLTV